MAFKDAPPTMTWLDSIASALHFDEFVLDEATLNGLKFLLGDALLGSDSQHQQQDQLRHLLTHGRVLESTNDDAFWPVSTNSSYTPSADVLNGHKLSGGAKFNPASTAYLQQVVTVPIVFLVLGVVSFLFTNLGLCFRCCCQCCKCLPKQHGDTPEEKVHALKTQRRGWFILFAVLALFVLIADFLCFFGYNYIDAGVSKFFEAIGLLQAIVDSIKADALAMNNPDSTVSSDVSIMSAASIQAQGSCCSSMQTPKYLTWLKDQPGTCQGSSNNGCPYASNDPALSTIRDSRHSACGPVIDGLVKAVPVFATATEAILSAVSPLSKLISDFVGLAKQYLVDLRKLAILVIFAIALVDVILLSIAAMCQSRKFMKFSIAVGMLFYLIIIILCFPFMILTSVLGDLCTHPTRNLARQVTGSTRSIIVYYSTCIGDDVIRDNLIQAKNSTAIIAGSVAKMTQQFCPFDTSLAEYNGALKDVSTQIGNVADTVSCPRLSKVLHTFLDESVCGGIYSGIYSIWVSQLITSFFLLMLLIVSSVLYQHFGSSLKVVAGGQEDEQGYATAQAYKVDDEGGGEGDVEMLAKIDDHLEHGDGGAQQHNQQGHQDHQDQDQPHRAEDDV